MTLEGIQHCDKYEQNEDCHLSGHGNEEEVTRQNSNAFPLQKNGSRHLSVHEL